MKNVKDYDAYILNENVSNEIPEDGTYTGWVCSINLHLNETGKDYKMEFGPKARFDGEFVIKDGFVRLMKGTQHLGGKDHQVLLKPEGMGVGAFREKDLC